MFQRKSILKGLALLVVSSVALGCSADTKSAGAKPVAWGYAGEIGPEHWGDLSPDYAIAKSGHRQSPIDIRGARVGDLKPIRFAYRTATVDVVNNGHSIQQDIEPGSWIAVDGKEFALKQFHFHSPSENTIEGRHAEMEMHLVHESADGELAVVALMIDTGAENAAFAPLWRHLPTEVGQRRTSTATVDVSSMLPAARAYFRFDGSLTTPPCTEGVIWLVLESPIELSGRQIAQFRAIIDGNNRPVQAQYGRPILKSN